MVQGAPASYSAQASASGVATVTIKTRTRDRRWVISQISVEMASAPIGTACVVRFNGLLVTPMIATGDAASGDPPVILNTPSDVLTITWSGATPGAVGNVLIFYDEQRV